MPDNSSSDASRSADARSALDELARLRAENARLTSELAEQRDRFDRVMHNETVGYLISSFELNRFIDANRTFCEFIGMQRDELLATDPYQFWLDTTFADDKEAEYEQIRRVADGAADHYRMQKRYVRRGGEVRWAETSFSAIRDEQRRLKYAVIACVDSQQQRVEIEARERLQGRLLQAQKLETIGRLVGGVAHDFNNRLLVIMGHADLLKRRVGDDAALAGYADTVIASARHAADLTSQLLAYGRRQVLRLRSLDPNAVVDGMRQMLERTIGEQTRVVTELEAKSPVLADAGQLEHVLMNLVLNARDAMPNGGTVTLRSFDVEVSAAAPVEGLEPGAYVALAVTDTGTGVPEASRGQIFEPFYTTKDVGQGTGLGLATVEGIVRQSGGTITLTSSEGRGSTFTVYLRGATEPVAESTPPTKKSEKTRYTVCGRREETILVVDDEDDVRRLLVEALDLGGYRLLEARNAQEALDIVGARAVPPSLLVTDIAMPGMSGMELSDRLRARTPELKVLVISGYGDRERARALHENERFLLKPFLPDELCQAVTEFLSEKAAAALTSSR